MGGSDILDIFSNIDPNEWIVWYLASFSHSLWYIWEVFIPVIELTLFSIDVWMLANQVRSFYPPTLKFYECACYYEPCPRLMTYLIALMFVWSSLTKMHVMCHMFKLTFMFYDSAWEVVQVCTLTLFYGNLILFGMLFFKITLVYLGIHDQPFNCHASLNLVSRDLFRA